jgi:hypothetical protein
MLARFAEKKRCVGGCDECHWLVSPRVNRSLAKLLIELFGGG